MKNMLLAIIVFVVVGCATTPVHADEVRVAVGGWSKHFMGVKNVTNENHKILGVEYKGYSAGYFENSYGRDTFFLAKNWRGPIAENWNWIASAGINRGYRQCFGDDGDSAKICPHGYVGVEYDKYRLVHSFKVVPGAIAYSPEIKF